MLEWVVTKFIALLGPIVALGKEKRELADNALRAISHALNETYLYYQGIEQGKMRDREIEAQLARYWSAAAIPIRHIDKSLAQICEYKSQYWVNPDTWDNLKIKGLGIGLNRVRQKYRALLFPKKSKRRATKRP